MRAAHCGRANAFIVTFIIFSHCILRLVNFLSGPQIFLRLGGIFLFALLFNINYCLGTFRGFRLFLFWDLRESGGRVSPNSALLCCPLRLSRVGIPEKDSIVRVDFVILRIIVSIWL